MTESSAVPNVNLASINALLQGRKVRLVRPGEVMTQDVQPGRLTIFVDASGRIARIQIEADNPAI
ncbi:MAG: hypothetical protein HYZ45_11190 [Burkholderiales bacterium]|nr:hypothetical protein [Burkholderiales bacterium]